MIGDSILMQEQGATTAGRWFEGHVHIIYVPYLASVPISFLLIRLTQLVQHLVVCLVANLTPGELRSRISGATGHSQGIVSAVVIAASGTFEEFADNSSNSCLQHQKWYFRFSTYYWRI